MVIRPHPSSRCHILLLAPAPGAQHPGAVNRFAHAARLPASRAPLSSTAAYEWCGSEPRLSDRRCATTRLSTAAYRSPSLAFVPAAMAPAEEAPRVRSASIGSMSSLLLQGWAMLADSCPACGVSLLRSAAAAVLAAPVGMLARCQRPGVLAPHPRLQTVPSPPPQVPLMRHPAGTVLLCVNCGRDTTTAADGGAAELAEPPAAAPAAPAGPAADAGPAGPATDLQSLPNGLGSSAVSSDSEEQGGEPVVAAAPPPLRERLRRAAGISSDPPADGSSGGQREDASKEIADLMLQGWAMLQEHCPR